jgi:hypothetical protein
VNIVLWIVQAILAIKLITVTLTHGLQQNKPAVQDAAQKMGKFSKPLLVFIAFWTFLGTAGLILPELLGWAAWITPVTAAIMGASLLVSLIFHVKFREKPKIFVSLVLFAFAAFVAYGRWVLLPFE